MGIPAIARGTRRGYARQFGDTQHARDRMRGYNRRVDGNSTIAARSSLNEGKNMKNTITAIAAAGVLALASTTFTSDAQAQRCRGCGVGLGIVGGLAAGAAHTLVGPIPTLGLTGVAAP